MVINTIIINLEIKLRQLNVSTLLTLMGSCIPEKDFQHDIHNIIKNLRSMVYLLLWLRMLPGFHPATKIWGGSAINEWAYSAYQVPWDVF